MDMNSGALKTSNSLVRMRTAGNYVELVKPAAPHGLTPIAAHPPWQSPIAVNIFNDRGAMGETRGRMHKVALPELSMAWRAAVVVFKYLNNYALIGRPPSLSGTLDWLFLEANFSSVASPRLGAEITS